MRRSILVALALLGCGPLAAQSRPVAPAPSILFVASDPTVSTNLVAGPGGMTELQGALIGAGLGASIGALAVFALSDRVTCEDCTEPVEGNRLLAYAVGMGAGAIVGLIIGGSLADQ